MKTLLRMLACGTALVVALLAANYLLVPCLGNPPPLAPELPGLCRLLWDEQTKGDDLDERDRAMIRVLHSKAVVADEVAAGRLSLAEAIARFRALQTSITDARDAIGSSVGTDDESMGRNVIVWVSLRLRDDPARQAEVIARLEIELARIRNDHANREAGA